MSDTLEPPPLPANQSDIFYGRPLNVASELSLTSLFASLKCCIGTIASRVFAHWTKVGRCEGSCCQQSAINWALYERKNR